MRLWDRSDFGLGPPQTPPPTRFGGFMSPARTLPVPFCLYSLRPDPVTSLRPLVDAVKRLFASSSATTARCITCSFGSAVNCGPSRSKSDLSPLLASKRCAFAILLTHLPDLDHRALATGDAASHPQLVSVGVHGNDPQVPHRDALVTHLPRHPLPGEDPSRVRRSPGRTR